MSDAMDDARQASKKLSEALGNLKTFSNTEVKDIEALIDDVVSDLIAADTYLDGAIGGITTLEDEIGDLTKQINESAGGS